MKMRKSHFFYKYVKFIPFPNCKNMQRLVKVFTPEDYSEPRNSSQIALTGCDGTAAEEVIVVQQYHIPSYGTQV